MLHEASRILLAFSVMAVALRYPYRDIRRHGKGIALLLAVVLPMMAIVSGGREMGHPRYAHRSR